MAIPVPFAPAPTRFTGGIARMIRCFETCRDANAGGYGSGVVQTIQGWGKAGAKKVTTCSPFTATVIGMLFDPSGADSGPFKPMFDDGKRALPNDFYSLHNGAYFPTEEEGKAVAARRKDLFKKNGWPFSANDSAGSLVFFNLGYEIDPKDMRRGDFVAIDWYPRGGHATFCWDVHLNADHEVDAFLFASSNGALPSYVGAGVSVGTAKPTLFVEHQSDGTYRKRFPLFVDRPEYIQWGAWKALKGVGKKDIDLTSFKDPGPVSIGYAGAKGGIGEIRVVRLWGMAPPKRTQTSPKYQAKFDLARQLATEEPPESYATGTGKAPAVHIEKAPPSLVKANDQKADPEAKKKVPPKPVEQKPAQPLVHQQEVEHALQELFQAGWITKDPGHATSLNDAATKAAVREFQEKWDGLKVDGIAGPKTRAALREALAKLHAGEPPPHGAKAADKKPHIEHLYWMTNRVLPGNMNGLVLLGKNLDAIQTFALTLRDTVSGHQERLQFPLVAVSQRAAQPVFIPQSFKPGAVLLAHAEGTGADGTKLTKDSEVPLYLAPPPPEPPKEKKEATQPTPPPASAGGWPWDESRWPAAMRHRLEDLRNTPRPTGGTAQRREITQYYVKVGKAGDTPVLDRDGNVIGRVDLTSLRYADIEGTLRLPDGRVLNIDSSHGTLYGPKECVVDGKKVMKNKPVGFDPTKSRWKDVSSTNPWGSGAGGQGPLIPFRTLAHNPKERLDGKKLYGRKVYVKQLDGLKLPNGETHNGICYVGDCGGMRPGEHFDFFIGTEDGGRALHLPTTCDVVILD